MSSDMRILIPVVGLTQIPWRKQEGRGDAELPILNSRWQTGNIFALEKIMQLKSNEKSTILSEATKVVHRRINAQVVSFGVAILQPAIQQGLLDFKPQAPTKTRELTQ